MLPTDGSFAALRKRSKVLMQSSRSAFVYLEFLQMLCSSVITRLYKQMQFASHRVASEVENFELRVWLSVKLARVELLKVPSVIIKIVSSKLSCFHFLSRYWFTSRTFGKLAKEISFKNCSKPDWKKASAENMFQWTNNQGKFIIFWKIRCNSWKNFGEQEHLFQRASRNAGEKVMLM